MRTAEKHSPLTNRKYVMRKTTLPTLIHEDDSHALLLIISSNMCLLKDLRPNPSYLFILRDV